MAFEARDSAAKVGPAKLATSISDPDSYVTMISARACSSRTGKESRTTGCQTSESMASETFITTFNKKNLIGTLRRFSK